MRTGLCLLLSGIALVHTCAVLAHRPDQTPHQFADLGEFAFEGGGKIPNLRMSYVTHGKLNAAKDNAILFQHGFAANHHLFDHMFGPGKPLDTDRYFIICPDALGATQTTYEHSTSPTNSGLKMKFPFYNGRDMVRAQYQLITEKLGIKRLLAVTGISSGADHSVQFAVSYADFMDGIIPIVGGTPFTVQGRLIGSWMISIIENCAGWDGGDYDENPKQCAANALTVLMPYLYTRDWWEANVDTPEAYTKWRDAWGDYYLDVQDARDLYYRAMASGRGWLGDTPGFDGDLDAALRTIRARSLFILSPQDNVFPPQYVAPYLIPGALAASKADMSMWNAMEFIPYMDADKPVVVLAGIHGGCFEVFANERIRSVRDLKGRTVAVTYLGGGDHILLSSMLAYVGMNPSDVVWMPGTSSLLDAMDAFSRGKADAFVGFAQQPVELRARKIGHVIIDTTNDRPWSQYYCCMLGANRDFAKRYPVTTKRALRAILKSADLCASDPRGAARFLSDKLYEPRFQIGLEVVGSLPYNRWREANPEDTIRFHALRLHEVGMVKNTPQKLIAQGTDRRFLNELKRELKA
jgi:homoserine acetyltransferase/ABC-type nitrate/sulfonate/bicarbonate transport system substrate-binding protein